MASKPQRITNGHRAAVCGLIIAGVIFRDACSIAGAPFYEMRRHLPGNWWNRQPARRLDDHQWIQIRAAYEAGIESVDDLCARMGLGTKTLYRRIAAAGWKRRGAGRRKHPQGIRQLLPHQRRAYRRMWSKGVPYEEALKVALRTPPAHASNMGTGGAL